MNNSDLALHGISGAVLVLLLVKALTTAGLPSKHAPLAALVSGFAIAGGIVADSLWPAQADPFIKLFEIGLWLGVGASGVYSQVTAGKVDPQEAASAVLMQSKPEATKETHGQLASRSKDWDNYPRAFNAGPKTSSQHSNPDKPIPPTPPLIQNPITAESSKEQEDDTTK